MKLVSHIAVVAIAAMVMIFPVQAGTIAADYLGGGTESNYPWATGYFFTPNVNLSVTDLGYYDHGTLGLTDSHEVGIFLASGTLVVNASIPSGTSAPFVAGTVGGTRFQSVTATPLSAGTEYYIVADNNSNDTYAYGTGAVSFASQITWNGYGDSSTNTIYGSVVNSGGARGNLGPNFRFDEAGVPEPATLALVISGLGLVLALRRRPYSRSST
jgi:FlaG/FlaF family flagellin (archaellin)